MILLSKKAKPMLSILNSLASKSLFSIAAITTLSISEFTSAKAQMRVKCEGKSGYQRLASWLGGETGYGGYYETEICGRSLGKSDGQAEFVIAIFGKDGSGKGIFSMNCANKPKGYWASKLSFSGYDEDLKRNMPKALRQASKLYC